MKKFLFVAVAVLLLGSTVTSCKGKTESNKLNDSITELLGQFMGNNLKASFQFMPERFKDIDKEQMLRGIMEVVNMDTTKADQSYMQGMQMGMQVNQQLAQLQVQGVNIDRKVFINELKKVLNSKDTLDMAKMDKYMQETQTKLMGMVDRAVKAKGIENGEAGKKYIEEQMKNDKAFKKTQSGIAYKVVKEGTGANFVDDDMVNVAYVGKHIDGRTFDSSNGKEVPFSMKGVVPGFSEVLKLMKPGSKVIAIIPGNMAYKDQGDGRKIGPNETLVFEITAGKATKAPAPASYPGRPAPTKGAQPAAAQQPQAQGN